MTGNSGTKRKSDTPEPDQGTKKVKLVSGQGAKVRSRGMAGPSGVANTTTRACSVKGKEKEVETQPDEDEEVIISHSIQEPAPKERVIKLAPPRPFPTVPTSVSATGPRSAHTEGKNCICVTRKTPLGAYLRRCKEVILKDGQALHSLPCLSGLLISSWTSSYKTLHISAMGAAIPHAVQLSLSLPSILPHESEEIQTEVLTGSVEVKDEVIPEDDDDDIAYRTRGKSTIMIIMKIGDGVNDASRRPRSKIRKPLTVGAVTAAKQPGQASKKGQTKGKRKKVDEDNEAIPERIVIRADDLDEE